MKHLLWQAGASSKHPKFPLVVFFKKTSNLSLNPDGRIHLPCPTEDQRRQQNTLPCAQVAPALSTLKIKMRLTVLLSPRRTGLKSQPSANLTRTPLHQATVKSQISSAGGKAIFKCVARVDIGGRAQEGPSHLRVVSDSAASLYCLNVK